jgi:hypothetical protein
MTYYLQRVPVMAAPTFSLLIFSGRFRVRRFRPTVYRVHA